MVLMTTILDPVDQPLVDGASQLRREELASFLRSRRERISPVQVGLPNYGRRRTPGLRREEVAQLAGVGVTWYTWLEQGRPINVSEQVLEAISRVLMLDPHERSHLFVLAGASLPEFETECQGLPAAIPMILEKLHPYPAMVTNGRFDILSYNRAYTALIGDLDSLPFDQRNSLWLVCTSPVMREVIFDRDEALRRLVAQYRANMADHVGEPAWRCLVNRLHEVSPEFARLWSHHEVAAPENFVKHMKHPELGVLNVRLTNLWVAPRVGLRLVTYSPEDEETSGALARVDSITPRPLY
jgi:transcriptional regulator with XRE-family HTH domain